MHPVTIHAGAERRIATLMRKGAAPTLLFLPGYASDMRGGKAEAIDGLAEQLGLAMLRLDYSGTGESPGRFQDGTLAHWIEDALAAVDQLTAGPMIVIGSSMGGWIAAHVALARPDWVKAIVGIAAAPDFTEWGFSQEDRATLKRDGVLARANAYAPEPMRTYLPFWESGQALRLLDSELAFDGPVRLIHGTSDPDVPVDVAHRLMAALRSRDVQLTLIKGAGHRLSEPGDLRMITSIVAELVNRLGLPVACGTPN
jgi:pimeloyl-ACP methyl ester carboxylesterase